MCCLRHVCCFNLVLLRWRYVYCTYLATLSELPLFVGYYFVSLYFLWWIFSIRHHFRFCQVRLMKIIIGFRVVPTSDFLNLLKRAKIAVLNEISTETLGNKGQTLKVLNFLQSLRRMSLKAVNYNQGRHWSWEDSVIGFHVRAWWQPRWMTPGDGRPWTALQPADSGRLRPIQPRPRASGPADALHRTLEHWHAHVRVLSLA